MKKSWAPIALAVLAIVDVVLIYLAFRHTRSGDTAAAQDAGSVTTAVDPAGDGSTGGPTTSGSQAPASNGLALISLGSGDSVLRASTGSCEGGAPAVLEVSSDGGESFETVPGTTPEILRVITRSQANLQYVGADQDCQTALYQSVDGGQTWSKGPSEGTWHLAPGGGGVIGPDGPLDPGCEVVSLSVLSRDGVVVACADDTVRTTTNGGTQWSTAGSVPDLVSVSFLNQGNGYALAGGEQCAAGVWRTNDGGATWNGVGCIEGSTPQALDAIGQLIVATVDGEAHISTDGGATWN